MRLYRFIYFLFLIAACDKIQAQVGKITFERSVYYKNIDQKLPHLTTSEKDRMAATKNRGDTGNEKMYLLYFQKEFSQYKIQTTAGYYGDEDKDIFNSYYTTKTIKDLRYLPDAKYLVEDNLPKYSWKILNEFKDVAGYVCMKAETRDTVNNVVVHAWFTDKIPYFTGPEGYHGLPGMILLLEFNQNDVVIEATKVEWMPEDFELKEIKKIKGKKVNYQKFNTLKKKHIQNYLDKKYNPYWWVRY